jgi:hypothetical protein
VFERAVGAVVRRAVRERPVREGRDEVQFPVEEERVVRRRGGHLELPVAEPVHLHLAQPPPRLAAAAEHRRVVTAVELVPEDVPTKRRAQVR